MADRTAAIQDALEQSYEEARVLRDAAWRANNRRCCCPQPLPDRSYLGDEYCRLCDSYIHEPRAAHDRS